ncbi:MAG: EF-hand domain-containing protein [Candidatus Competibacteraceae bacterium]
MKTRTVLLLSCTTGLLLASGVSLGDTDGIEQSHAKAVVQAIFNRLDCDLDGTVDPSEVGEHIAQLWHPIDRDQSRTLSKKEYALTHRAVPEDIGTALFRDADADGDGQISVSEFRHHLERMIVKVDSNGDREVSLTEVGLKPMPTFKKNPFVTAKFRSDGS